ncbi:glutathione S-transferase [Coccomyxa subellipsoidea C-169]|uniref:Glutathione S-transferase n=1 Tax=Coccomyxa subellipsoidea (strain C-169) TaxID=574566 RepID=I0YSD9_COCSC|nr:glutathione S-transferase [Coccomyxa subellipsoidea C-169]EIE21308.1 glutathione S-transferase [Coccomyxa subellipsoidea C-169]|eukprot:XP_005645852.1 glutathione S-transferase [Coccomyxa subellipsoidea C-169]
MSNLRLYTFPGNKNAWKAQIAAEYVGVKLDVPAFEMGKTNKSPQFLKLNPNGKVPTLQTPEGGIWESNAIARYVARLADKGLFGATAYDAALVEQWIEFATGELDAPLASWYYPIAGYMEYNKKKEEAAIATVKKSLGVLNEYLATHTFLVGNSVTLADIVGAANLYHGYTKLFDEAFRKDFPNVQRWFLTLVNQPEFKKVMGEVALAKEALTYQAKKNDKPAPAAKKESKPEPPKKESKPAPAAKEAAAAEEGEEKPAPKPKDPLASLPPSKMIMDSWKRLYSNTPGAKFKEICVNGLWNGADIPNSPNNEGFDPEGYSIWFCEYKYPEENTVNFIVMNKACTSPPVGGFLQRIDYVRKHAFAVMSILKDDKGQFPIRGMWIFRGQEIPAIMVEECFDLPLYEWNKVDTSDAAVRERISSLLCEEDKIDGLENVEVKVFK